MMKVALVGVGRMGRNHLRVLRETPGFQVVACVDANAAPTDLGAIPFFKTVDELRGVAFDTAVIATTTATHFDVAKEIISMGKHLLIEKPIASTYIQSREIVAAAEAKGVKLAVGHVERFNPAVRKLREVIAEGWLGTPIHYSFTRVGGYPETLTTGNNVLLDLAVHDIDVLRSLAGAVRLEHSMCHVTWRDGVFDTAEITLGTTSGPSASVHVNWITPTKIRTIRVTGTRGVCFVDYILQTCELHGGGLLKAHEPQSTSFEAVLDLYRSTDKIAFGVQRVEPLRAQAAQFHRFLTTGESGELCVGRDAVAAVLLAEKAVQVDRQRSRDKSVPAPTQLPLPSDEWI